MKTIQINKESFPIRCEICHQTDLFDPEALFCKRCNLILLQQNHASQNIQIGKVLFSAIFETIVGCVFGLVSGFIFSFALHEFTQGRPNVPFIGFQSNITLFSVLSFFCFGLVVFEGNIKQIFISSKNVFVYLIIGMFLVKITSLLLGATLYPLFTSNIVYVSLIFPCLYRVVILIKKFYKQSSISKIHLDYSKSKC